MRIITYTFADGHKEELEVTDEVAEVFYELEKYEQKVNRKETRRHVSLDMPKKPDLSLPIRKRPSKRFGRSKNSKRRKNAEPTGKTENLNGNRSGWSRVSRRGKRKRISSSNTLI